MTRRFLGFVLAVAGVLSAAGPVRAQQPAPNPLDVIPDKMPFDVPYGPPITLDRAQAIVAAAIAEATKHDWKMNVAVADAGGNLVAFARMDGAQLASIAVAEAKARAAATFRRETKAFESALQDGRFYVLAIPGVVGARGGIPLVEDGKLVGAIGVSGGTGSQDEACAKAGVAALR